MAVGAFVSVIFVALSWVAIEAYAYTGISKEVHSCFKAELSASRAAGKLQLTNPEMREILNRSVDCARKRIGSFEAFFWNEERAKNSIRVIPVK